MRDGRLELRGRGVRREPAFAGTVLDSARHAVIATDPGGEVIYWNRAAEGLYGWPAAEARGRRIEDLTLRDSAPERSQPIPPRFGNGRRSSGEFLVRRRDGTSFVVAVATSPMFHADGQLAAVIVFSADACHRSSNGATAGRCEVLPGVPSPATSHRSSNGAAAGRCEVVPGVPSPATSHRSSNGATAGPAPGRRGNGVEPRRHAFAVFSSIRDTDGVIVDFRLEYVRELARERDRASCVAQVGHTLPEVFSTRRDSRLFDGFRRVVESHRALAEPAFVYEETRGEWRRERTLDIQAVKVRDGVVATWRDVTAPHRGASAPAVSA